MGTAIRCAALWAAMTMLSATANAQLAAQPTSQPSIGEYTGECKCKRDAHEGRAAFWRLRQALHERRAARLLAIGSSSIVGVGASEPNATFPVRLEGNLETTFKGVDFDVLGRGMSGEMATATAARLREEALRFRPDLIVWQVGTNDAVNRADLGAFASLLQSTLQWLKGAGFDVVLIDPQFTEQLANDGHYVETVRTITRIARAERVRLVHRYDAMEDLASGTAAGERAPRRSYLAEDRFHLNDLGYRCMAEYASRAIEAGLKLAEAEALQIGQ
jgi:lysophospholipase L1-like esterase